MKRFQWARAGRLTVACGLFLAAGMVGCAGDNGDLSRNFVQVAALNNNGPLFADVYNNGNNADVDHPEDDYIPADAVAVTFMSHTADGTLTMDPTKPFGTVQFTRYTVDFKNNDLNGDGHSDVNDIDGPMNLVVPVDGQATGAVLVVPAGVKGTGYLASLHIAGGEAFTEAKLTFYGEEQTSHDKVVLESALIVGFADYADKKN